jgi:hypothetical protein
MINDINYHCYCLINDEKIEMIAVNFNSQIFHPFHPFFDFSFPINKKF